MIVLSGDAAQAAAVDTGLHMARALGAEVLFFHVMTQRVVPLLGEAPPLADPAGERCREQAQEGATRILAAAAAQAHAQGVACTQAAVWGGDPAACVAQAAHDLSSDLIVAASPQTGAMRRWLHGSVVRRLVDMSPVPVLCVKGLAHADSSGHRSQAPG